MSIIVTCGTQMGGWFTQEITSPEGFKGGALPDAQARRRGPPAGHHRSEPAGWRDLPALKSGAIDAPGALAKAVFVAIACVEAIALCRLRKLVSTVSCCGALKDAQCRRATQSCGNCIPTISFLCYVNAVPVAVTPSETLAKRTRVLRVLKRRNSAP